MRDREAKKAKEDDYALTKMVRNSVTAIFVVS